MGVARPLVARARIPVCPSLATPLQTDEIFCEEVYLHSKNEVVILTISLSCWLQMSEPVSCMDTVNC